MRLIPRVEWGFQGPLGPQMPLPSRGLYLHHSVTTRTADPHADMRTLERIGKSRFGRLSYSWAFHVEARVFLQGQDTFIGAHTHKQNSTTHGLVLIGNFENEGLPDAAVRDIGEFIAWGADTGRWAPVLLGGHRDVGSTACPGRNAYARIPHIRAAINQPRSWFDMATKEELRAVVREEIERATKGRDVGRDLQVLRTSVREVAANQGLDTAHTPTGKVEA